MYSVFYSNEKGFFQLRTDFDTQEMAEYFIQSKNFQKGILKFQFMLKDGKELISGTPLKNDPEHFKAAMRFALEIPKTDYSL
ncbi:MAG TPA: hypothetical protein VKZ57_02710 [Sphingobacterium sp.]|nr:hypothetical protein [Sphingobacterium sp.]